MGWVHRGDFFAAGSVDFGVGVYESGADEEDVCGTEVEVLCCNDIFEIFEGDGVGCEGIVR